MTTITVRLPDEIESDLRRRLEVDGLALSDFVRQAIAEKLSRERAPMPTAFELGRDLFGRYGDGDQDGSAQRKARIGEFVHGKHHRR